MYLRQQLRATNDVNGNPRRVWVLYKANKITQFAGVIEAIDEGYTGDPFHGAAKGTPWRESVQLPGIDVSPKEYRAFLKYHGKA